MVNFAEKPPLYARGEQIAGYRILFHIGSGSFGSLYLVRDITGAAYALKILHNGAEREFSALQKMRSIPSHPGLTAIHAAGRLDDGSVYYLLDAADNLAEDDEYVPDTLENRLARRGPLPMPEVFRLGVSLLPAIRHLHEHGAAHHDIKPENIIFIRDMPMLADFGSLDSADAKGYPASSRGFFPPEELSGTVNGHFSRKNDLYALGMTLYCAWSGHAPEDFPMLPDKAAPAEIRSIRKLLLRACDPDPAYRFQSAEEFQEAVIHAQKAATAFAQRRRKIIWGTTIVFCGIALLISGILKTRSMNREKDFQKKWQITDEKITLARIAEEKKILVQLKAAAKRLSREEAEKLKIPENLRKFQSLHDLHLTYRQWKKTSPEAQRKLAENLIGMAEKCPSFYKDPVPLVYWHLDAHKKLSKDERITGILGTGTEIHAE